MLFMASYIATNHNDKDVPEVIISGGLEPVDESITLVYQVGPLVEGDMSGDVLILQYRDKESGRELKDAIVRGLPTSLLSHLGAKKPTKLCDMVRGITISLPTHEQ